MNKFIDLISILENNIDDKKISYIDRFNKYTLKNISDYSNILACKLRDLNIKKGDVVIVFVPHSSFYVISALAIFRLNAIYVPLNDSTPIEKIEKIISKADAKAIITYKPLIKKTLKIKTIYIEDLKLSRNIKTIKSVINKNDYAYIVTTSGSTGEPKLILHTHDSFMFHLNLNYEISEFNFDNKTISAVVSNFAHVPTIHFAFSPITKKSIAYIPDLKILQRGDIFYKFLIKNKINYTVLPPGIREQLLENYDLSKIRVQVLGDKIRNFNAKCRCHVLNLYGSSETFHTCYSKVTGKEKDIPLGKIASKFDYVLLDKNNKIIKNEGQGELLLFSTHFFKEYYKDIENTKKKFYSINKKKYLRTFDIVRKDKNGVLYYVGRVDNMVKIRGYRVELEEVENAITKLGYKNLNNVACAAKEINHSQTLCCYYESKEEIDTTLIKDKLSKKLLDYMIPTYYIRLDRLPRNANGKVMRSSLPMPILTDKNTILNSIDLIRLASDAYLKEGIDIQFTELMKVRSLDDFLVLKEKYKDKSKPSLKSYHKKEALISDMQKNLLDSYALHSKDLIFNLPHLIKLKQTLKISDVKKALINVVKAHPVLNTNFKMVGSKIMQYISNDNVPNVKVFKIDDSELKNTINSLIKPFDIFSSKHLYRFALININTNLFLFLDINHVIFDGTSLDNLLKDFSSALDNKKLIKEDYNYLDYSIDEHKYLKSDQYLEDYLFWKEELDYFKSGTLINSDTGFKYVFGEDALVSKEIDSNLIRDIKNKYNCSLSAVYLGITMLTIKDFIKENKISISLISSGRNKSCLNALYGFFSKMLPFNFAFSSNKNYFKEIENKLIEVINHERCDINNLSHNYESYILFAYQENLIDIKNNPYIKNIENLESGSTRYPLKIFVVSKENKCYLNFSYIKKMYSKKFVDDFINRFFFYIKKYSQ